MTRAPERPSPEQPFAEQPWSVPVALHEVPETGRSFTLVADDRAREAVAKLAGLRSLPRLEAQFEVTPRGRDGPGRLSGSGSQPGSSLGWYAGLHETPRWCSRDGIHSVPSLRTSALRIATRRLLANMSRTR